MTDISSTLDAIDEVAVHRCGHCDTPLGPEAPSSLFCDDDCQEAFHAARSEALEGYREPSDLPQHAYNQREERSPETTPQTARCHCGRSLFPWNEATGVCTGCENCDGECERESFDLGGFERWRGLGPGLRNDDMYGEAFGQLMYMALHTPARPVSPTDDDGSRYARGSVQWTITAPGWGHSISHVVVDETRDWLGLTLEYATTPIGLFGDLANWHPTGLITNSKIEATVEPGPECLTDGVEFDFDHPSTAALAAEASPVPVMAPYPLDVEAIQRHIDGGYLTPDRVRAARRIDPRRSR